VRKSMLNQVKFWLLLSALFILPFSSYGQASATELQQELLEMGETDQRRGDIRQVEEEFGYGSPEYLEAWDQQNAIDRKNQERLAEIVEQWGWPKVGVLGKQAAMNAFFIVQHADLVTQGNPPIFNRAQK